MICICLLAGVLIGCGKTQTSETNNGATGDTSGDDDYIYIGVTAGITGDAPLEGQAISQACQLAVELINEEGGVLGGKKLKLIVEDDMYTTEGAMAVANKFAADDRIVAVAGPGRSNCVVAISDIIKRANLPIITPATSPVFYDLDNPYIFRDRTTDEVISSIATRYMVEDIGVKKLGVMATADDTGIGALEVIKREIEDMGITNAVISI